MSTATKPETENTAPAEQTPRASARTASAPAGGGRRRFVLPIVAILVLAGLGWVYQKWSYGRVHESTDNAQVDGHLIPVLAKVGGYVAAVNVNENDRVAAGSTLVRIDDSEYRVRLAEAEADLAAARAQCRHQRDHGPGRGGRPHRLRPAVGLLGADRARRRPT